MVILRDPPSENVDVLRQHRSREKRYAFDRVFGDNSSQAAVYEATTKPLLSSILAGFNATVFAYGPTGAGKTFTMCVLGCDEGEKKDLHIRREL